MSTPTNDGGPAPTKEELDEFRIKVAESMGWKIENYGPLGYETLYWRLRRPNGTIKCEGQTGGEVSRLQFALMVPNYPGCLNACAAMEKTLSQDELFFYETYLQRAQVKDDRDDLWTPVRKAATYVWHASSLQRCRAFLAATEGRKEAV